jgi:hypothetical protein
MWTDPKVKTLPPTSKLLFCYLITNSHTHLSGIYYLPIYLMAHETGLTEAKVKSALKDLSILCRYDTAAEIVWVVNMLQYQGSGPKIVKSVTAQLESLHQTPLVKEFQEHYHTMQIPYRYPIDTVSSVGVKDQDQKKEKEQEKKQEPERFCNFDAFWRDYPKKVGKGAARRAWDKIKPDDDLTVKILVAIKDQRNTPQWKKEKGQFIPNPATWLNQERWSDSVEVETASAKQEPYIPAEEVTPEEKERRAANGLKGIQKVKELLGR